MIESRVDDISSWKTPHAFQLEIFQNAKDENSVVTIPTGFGKTFIASLIIYHFLKKNEQMENITIFLCPTRVLANQQCEALEKDLSNISPESFGYLDEEIIVKELTGDSPRVWGLPGEQFIDVDECHLRDWDYPQEWKVGLSEL